MTEQKKPTGQLKLSVLRDRIRDGALSVMGATGTVVAGLTGGALGVSPLWTGIVVAGPWVFALASLFLRMQDQRFQQRMQAERQRMHHDLTTAALDNPKSAHHRSLMEDYVRTAPDYPGDRSRIRAAKDERRCSPETTRRDDSRSPVEVPAPVRTIDRSA